MLTPTRIETKVRWLRRRSSANLELRGFMDERRREARFDVAAPAALKPVGSAPAMGLEGQVVNVSSHGVRVRVTGMAGELPQVGDLYRVRSSDDRMLCQVANSLSGIHGTDIGFRIVYWSETGALDRVILDHSRPGSRNVLGELRIPRLL